MKKTLLFSSICCFFTRFKISSIIGSYAAHFSALALVSPIIGFQMTCTQLTIGFGGLFLWMLLHCNSAYSMMLLYHIPSVMGMAYSCLAHNRNATQSTGIAKTIIAALIPILCIILFCTHPIGSHAWPYALLWIFPCLFPLLKRPAFFWHALASTLACHAVGSVLWLYSHHLTAHEWLTLMPITTMERLAIAVGCTGIYGVITGIITHAKVQKNWNKFSLWIKLKINPV